MPLNINVAPFGVGTINWTLRWRILGTSVWSTSSVSPTNPISASTTTAIITVPNENTIYELQILSNCGSTTSQSSIIKKIARECPTLLASNVITTDTSITVSTPIATPAPISNHIANILVELYQGLTLISNQLLTTPNSVNTVTFSTAPSTSAAGAHSIDRTTSPVLSVGRIFVEADPKMPMKLLIQS